MTRPVLSKNRRAATARKATRGRRRCLPRLPAPVRYSKGTTTSDKAPTEIEPQVLKTRVQMAARYQVAVRTIDYWVEDRTLPVYKRGGVVRFHPDECDEALKAFRTKSRWSESAATHEDGDNG